MSGETAYADWIAVDWGTSNLRAWAMARDGTALAENRSEDGMARLAAPEDFETALLALVDPWLGAGRIPVVACGMVGSRQGWAEAPYGAAPCAPFAGPLVGAPCRDPRLEVWIVPGAKQEKPADVMRGEETQIAGFLGENPGYDGIICLPGTHTKWVHVSAGEIVSFRTFMTGELFDLLSSRSVLRHSVGAGWDAEAFDDAISDAMAKPEALASRLFALRAETLLHGLSAGQAKARLSGVLIGMELAAARPYWLGQNVALVGAGGLVAHYQSALASQGIPSQACDGAEMTRAGLARARDLIAKEPTCADR